MICVGNLTVGGAGKTPVALALAALLRRAGHQPIFVSRGYGGSAKGPLRVDAGVDRAAKVGDEALLLVQSAPTVVGRDRAAAIRLAEQEGSCIILDDGLQNPHIAPNCKLLVVDAAAGFGNGYVLPAGPLRESLQQALPRIDAVIMVGEGAAPADFQGKPVFRARLMPQLPRDFLPQRNYFAFAGIGRPEKFYTTAREAGDEAGGDAGFP